VKPYTFDELVNTLNSVAPYDWRKHLTERLTSVTPHAPLGGMSAGGWKLEFNETPNLIVKLNEARSKGQDLTWSLGVQLSKEGVVSDALMGQPAANAGIGPGMKIVAVNGRKWSPELMATAIKEAKSATAPIELLIESNDFYRTYNVDYHGGMRYPHLVRNEEKEDRLAAVLQAKAK